MIETKLEINDKIGYLLFKKGIIDASTLDKALNAKFNDRNKLKRNLAQILVDDFKYEHDVIFREVAILYAFRELDIDLQTIQPNQLDSIRSIVESGGEELKEIMLKENIIPFMYDEQIKDKLIIASTDPTNKNVQKVAFGLNAKKTEVIFIKKKDYDQLIEKLFPPENKFLQNISDDYENLIPTEEREDLDEDELDAEINKSALINLVEGALVEAVRKGASDIHFIPGSGHRTEIYMRIDGTLRLWHVQENTLPEAVIAVVKDRGKGMDRFEREMAQDGFIQRAIDNYIIRFRVSVLPMVGTELKNKFESVVIRILDDRKVIKDLEKLGLTGVAKQKFIKAINQPQGMVILTGRMVVVWPMVNVRSPVSLKTKGAISAGSTVLMTPMIRLPTMIRATPLIRPLSPSAAATMKAFQNRMWPVRNTYLSGVMRARMTFTRKPKTMISTTSSAYSPRKAVKSAVS